MAFSTKECAWAQTKIKMLGLTITGVRSFEFAKNVEKEYLYAAGNKPIDIQTGNESYPVSLGLLKYEVDKLNAAARAAGYTDLTEVPHEAILITCTYRKRLTDAPNTIVAEAVAFNALPVSLNQNDKFTQVQMTGLAMNMVYL